MKNKTGFTLAEVLITLGILGVIAAMVMPVVYTNADHHIWMNSLKTAMSNLTNGFQQMKAVDMVSRMEDTTLWQDVVNEEIKSSNNSAKAELDKFFSIKDMGTGTPEGVTILNRNNTPFAITPSITDSLRLTLANNMILYLHLYKDGDKRMSTDNCNRIKGNGGSLCSFVAAIYVDVNGLRRPNRIGDDIYYFLLGSDGRLYPFGSTDTALYSSQGNIGSGNAVNGKNWTATCSGNPLPSTCTDPRMLTARVIDEGFEIRY